jgi:telomere length regulation protein
MEELLTPVTTTYLKPKKDEAPLLTEVIPHEKVETVAEAGDIASVDDAVAALRNQPSYDSLLSVLRYLTDDHTRPGAFQLHAPSPQSAAIIQVLIAEIAPNYWTLLAEGSADDGNEPQGHDRELFVQCLRSVTGINSILTNIKTLTQEFKAGGNNVKRPDIPLNLGIYLNLLAAVLHGNMSISVITDNSTANLASDIQSKVQSQNLLSLLTNGKIISVAAEARATTGQGAQDGAAWVADALEYSRWVGENIVHVAQTNPSDTSLIFCSKLFRRAMSLGYSGKLFHPGL